MAEMQVAARSRGVALRDIGGRLTPMEWTAVLATVVALVAYGATALRGVSFGDWAVMQHVPARLEVPHPTGSRSTCCWARSSA
jgi:hypothetical protein